MTDNRKLLRCFQASMLAAAAFALPAESPGQNHAQRAAQARASVAPPAQQSQGQRATTAGAVAGAGAFQRASPSVTNIYGSRPRPAAASASLSGVRQALTAFNLDTGRLPTAAEGLNALLYAPPGARNWRGPYISLVTSSGRPPFSDPWGNLYRLVITGHGARSSFTIKSNGPDGLPDTADDLSISG